MLHQLVLKVKREQLVGLAQKVTKVLHPQVLKALKDHKVPKVPKALHPQALKVKREQLVGVVLLVLKVVHLKV